MTATLKDSSSSSCLAAGAVHLIPAPSHFPSDIKAPLPDTSAQSAKQQKVLLELPPASLFCTALGKASVCFLTMCRGLASLPTSCLERAKEFKTRLGILLHKPDLGYKIGSLSRSTKQRYALEEVLGWKESFDHLLRSKSGLAAFHGFLKTEFSEENLEFWLACEEYKKTHSKAKLAAKANRIFEDFVQNEAPKEVNLDHETREATRRNLTIANSACFEEAQAKTHTLMEKDSYPRFLKSAYYRDLTEQATSHRTGKPTHT
ncbi:regulator of G-protein signaling 16-like [Podarcis raffonei]|uniref:regulator of G-protein signaling 16-like n=1 Tax=Podarcis raffonei TaxID=65483 RepID=UPI00232999D6|nr:regulator of G-protein signaling 16-like [Podarcis raffonei]